MKYFLELVADSLRQLKGNDLSRTIVVFPNKRASLFLNDYLTSGNGASPLWAPRYMSISELFGSLTDVQIADPIDTVCRLYHHYAQLSGSDDSLDFFYGWGERLLADFDDLDKNLGEAELVFRDLRDYQEISSGEILTDEQVEQLRRFVGDFAIADRSVIRERFLQLWRVMLPLYKALRADLAAEGLAYEGQLYRQVVEDFAAGKVALPDDVDEIAFVGFNVLDAVEKKLFTLLKAQGKALFYWDYDTYYIDSEGAVKPEAGVFLKENLELFPNALGGTESFSNFLLEREDRQTRPLVFAHAESEAIQAQRVTTWLADEANFSPKEARRTAIVLCNENLLQPVLHALPREIVVNVTKGFPMGHTPAFAHLVQEMERFTHDLRAPLPAPAEAAKGKSSSKSSADVPTALPLPSQAELIGALQGLQTSITAEAQKVKAQGDGWLKDLYTEAYFQVFTTLSRFIRLVEDGRLRVRHATLFRLVRQVAHGLSVPFHGEPAVGLQVMGVLETRCLDFDNLLLLSVGEGNIPQKATDASFIPFLIRKRYGLTTYLHKTAVYAYYFYRLLQRAKRVELTYNNSTAGTQKGEMSRFMRAMLVDERLRNNITRSELSSTPRPCRYEPTAESITLSSAQPFKTSFSPTAVNVYLGCKRAFYYQYVRKLKAKEEEASLIDPRDFGTVFHKAAETLYKEVLGKDGQVITPELLADLVNREGGAANRKGNLIFTEEVRKAFQTEQIPRVALIEMAVLRYLHQLVTFEAGVREKQALPAQSFRFQQAEYEVRTVLTVPFGKSGHKVEVEIAGNIDRLDVAVLDDGREHIRVIDYKTGGEPQSVRDMDALFEQSAVRQLKYPFQTFMYCLMLHDNPKQAAAVKLPITPALYYVPRMAQANFTPYIEFEGERLLDFGRVAADFKRRLTELLAEILDPDNTFEPCLVKEHCQYCDFKALCGQ